ncbi:MAG: putative transcriptional regulator [Alteromonadaceae bacterium]|jgi:predicted transcriptional regulator
MKLLKIRNYMSKRVVTFDKKMDIASAVEKLLQSFQMGGAVIDENDHVIGFISEQDCIQKMIESSYTGESNETIEHIMKKAVLTINWNDSIMELAEQMTQAKPKIYPVVNDENKIVGTITRSEVLSALDDYFHAVQ